VSLPDLERPAAHEVDDLRQLAEVEIIAISDLAVYEPLERIRKAASVVSEHDPTARVRRVDALVAQVDGARSSVMAMLTGSRTNLIIGPIWPSRRCAAMRPPGSAGRLWG
jgi:hypothetical protein